MADKDKKGWTSYLHKWWEWLVSILFKILRWIFSVEGVILLFTGGLMVLVVYEFFWWQTTEFFEVENAENAKSSQLLILTLGSIGAACGLILAARRSAKFSEQVDTAQKQVEIGQKQLEIAQKQADTEQKQLFNEQLGRGAELLANKEMVVRQTGIRVFEDFAERTPEQIKLIMQIIHDFVHANASSSSKGQKRLDIALGIRTLASLYNKSGRLVELEELVQFLGCHLEGLNFTETELQGAIFLGVNLQGADFFGASLQGANFIDANLREADLKCAKLQWADCTGTDFSCTENLTEEQVKGMIFEVNRPPRLSEDLESSLDPKRIYELKEDPKNEAVHYRNFVESDAEWSGKDVDEWIREYLASILNPKDDG